MLVRISLDFKTIQVQEKGKLFWDYCFNSEVAEYGC